MPRYTVREAKGTPEDRKLFRALGVKTHKYEPYSHLNHREGAEEAFFANIWDNLATNCVLFAQYHKDDEGRAPPEYLGFLLGNLQYFMTYDYLLALCTSLYIFPEGRGRRVGPLLAKGFMQWAETRQADEVRFFVTGMEKPETTHKVFSERMNMIYVGGNYIASLSERARQIWSPSADSGEK